MKTVALSPGEIWAAHRAPGTPKCESAGGADARPTRLRVPGLGTPGEARGPQTYQGSRGQAWELPPLSRVGTDHTCTSWPTSQGHGSRRGPEISHGHIG